MSRLGPVLAGSGGSGNEPVACAIVDEACCACTEVQCREEQQRCFEEQPECPALLSCVQACGANGLCVVGCYLQHSAGGVEMGLYTDCAATACTGSCPFDTPLEDCERCTYRACEPESEACWAEQDCWELIACSLACPMGDDACYAQCNAAHPTGSSVFGPLLACQRQQCGNVCT